MLSFVLIASNLVWYKLYRRESEKLKNVVVPSLSEDYFSKQILLTNYAKENEEIYENKNLESNFYDVPLVLQNPDYPNGCEAAAAVMLLQYYGIDITLKEFIEEYLPKQDVYEKNGKRYGPNPALYYAGDPANKTRGWGCFNTVVQKVLNHILEDNRSIHVDVNAVSKKAILSEEKKRISELVEHSPLLIWTTIEYEPADYVYTWIDSENNTNTYTYPKNGHVVVITGYDDSYYYINDPLKNQKNVKIQKEILEKSYDSLGRQSIYIE